ncbi:diguanylate cyclase [Thiomicrorhabdus sediminis]|uniref:diguanylate cyclase n=1 Tax=Thiomicrorhabdus sediminis TaxID=2580412 RepID=A0A4V1HHM2_9GAMM|nr:diguanylate cyclase [Thiomicrorhabdus sediminis]QCU89513.1 diguanylate cyclase [Thiomicrorhabdus sediminis]
MRKSIYVLLVAVTLVCSNLALAQTLTPIKVQINWHHQFQFAGFYAAIQQGYYRDVGLDVEISKWQPGIKVIDEVVSQRAQFGVGYSSVIANYAKGMPIKLVMTAFQYSPMVLLSHSPIGSLKEFSGKSVMHDENLQIMSLLDKARNQTTEPFIQVPPTGNLQDFIDNKVDLYGAYLTNEPPRLDRMGVDYHIVDPKAFGIQSYGDFIFTSEQVAQSKPEMVEDFKDATIKGWHYALEHQAEVVDYIVQHYPVSKDRQALLDEALRTKDVVKYGDLPVGSFYKEKLINTALEAKLAGLMTDYEFQNLNIDNFIYKRDAVLFTKDELEFIAKNPVIKLANDIDWEPFEYIDEQGAYKGIAADFFALISQRTGLQIEYVTDKTWAQVVNMAKQGELDAYSCAVSTPGRREYMAFTEAYLKFPMVIASTMQLGFVNDYKVLMDRKVAVVKGYWSDEYLSIRYPGMELVRFDSLKDALIALSNGEVDVYSGNLASIVYAVKKYGLTNIHVVGQLEETFDLAIGVNHSKPELFSIMQKALASISNEQRQAIYNHWLGLRVVKEVDYSEMFKLVAPLVLIIVLLMAFLALLIYHRGKKHEYLQTVYELSLASIISPKDFRIKWLSQSYRELAGITDKTDKVECFLYDFERIELNDLMQIRQQLLKGETVCRELTARSLSGNSYTVEARFSALKDWRNRLQAILVTRHDITDKKKIQSLAITDELTGLFNRRHFNEMLQQQVEHCRAQGCNLCAAMLDIDYFKQVNDNYGHLTGDEVLAKIAKVIDVNFSRANDMVFRVGGEEFFILSTDCNIAHFEKYAAQLVNGIEALSIKNHTAPNKAVTVSMGIKCYHADDLANAEEIYTSTDKLLYQAKQQGRNQAVIFSRK